MAERKGIEVFVSWADETDEWSAGDVLLTEIEDVAGIIYGQLLPEATGIAHSGLVLDGDEYVTPFYRVVLERDVIEDELVFDGLYLVDGLIA